MRIAIISPPWVPVPPERYGGTEAVIDNLARGLLVAGHDVLLFATGDSTCPVPVDWVEPTARGTAAARPATELRHVISAYESIAEWGADVVHDHTLMGPIYGQRYGIPIVTTNHGPFDAELSQIYRAVAPDVSVIAISHHQASTAPERCVATVIHHGVDVDTFPLGDGSGGYALFLGRMCPDKGVHTAARIAKAARVPLKIAAKVHEPEERRYFEEEVVPLLGDGVEFVGEVGGQTKLDLLANASCLLNPIAWPEPFGMVMIEALACGTPIVTTPCGSAPELIDDGTTGFIRPTETDLADVLARVHTLDRRACREAAAERFSTERMVAEHIALYEQVVAGRTATPPTAIAAVA